jgi:uncharacterized membrane protein YfcA
MTTLLPELLSQLDVALLVFTAFVASYITAALGIGGGLLLLSVMANIVPITHLIPVHGIVQVASNAGRAAMLWRSIDARMLLYFSVGSVAGYWLAPYIIIELSLALLQISVAAFILLLQWGPKLRFAAKGKAALVVQGGVITLLSSLVGATGPLVASILNHLQVKQVLVATMAAMQTVQHSMKSLVFVQLGVDLLPWLGLILLMVVAGFAGTHFGLRKMMKLPEDKFRFWFRWLITLLSLRMLALGLLELFSA